MEENVAVQTSLKLEVSEGVKMLCKQICAVIYKLSRTPRIRMGNGGITPHISNLGARSRREINFTSWALYAERKLSDFTGYQAEWVP